MHKEGSRSAPAAGESGTERPEPDTLRLASFNIEFALQVDSALAVLSSDPGLRGADILLLQEIRDELRARR